MPSNPFTQAMDDNDLAFGDDDDEQYRLFDSVVNRSMHSQQGASPYHSSSSFPRDGSCSDSGSSSSPPPPPLSGSGSPWSSPPPSYDTICGIRQQDGPHRATEAEPPPAPPLTVTASESRTPSRSEGGPVRQSSFYRSLLATSKASEAPTPGLSDCLKLDRPAGSGKTEGLSPDDGVDIPQSEIVAIQSQHSGLGSLPDLSNLSPPVTETKRQSSFYLSLMTAAGISGSGETPPPLSRPTTATTGKTGAAQLEPDFHIPPPLRENLRQSSFYKSLMGTANGAPTQPSKNSPQETEPPTSSVEDQMRALRIEQETYYLSLLAPPEVGPCGASDTGADPPTATVRQASLTPAEIVAIAQAAEAAERGAAPPPSEPTRRQSSFHLSLFVPPDAYSSGAAASGIAPPTATVRQTSLTPEEVLAISRAAAAMGEDPGSFAAAEGTEKMDNGSTSSPFPPGKDVQLVGQALDADMYQEQLAILEKIRMEQDLEQIKRMEMDSASATPIFSAEERAKDASTHEAARLPSSTNDVAAFGLHSAALESKPASEAMAGEMGSFLDRRRRREETEYRKNAGRAKDDGQATRGGTITQVQGPPPGREPRRAVGSDRKRENEGKRPSVKGVSEKGVIGDLSVTTKLLMKGNKETWEAIANGDAHVVKCLGCKGRMQVAKSASLVFCPICRTVSPAQSSDLQDPNLTSDDDLNQNEGSRMQLDSYVSDALQRQEYLAQLAIRGEDVTSTDPSAYQSVLDRTVRDKIQEKMEKYGQTRQKRDRDDPGSKKG